MHKKTSDNIDIIPSKAEIAAAEKLLTQTTLRNIKMATMFSVCIGLFSLVHFGDFFGLLIISFIFSFIFAIGHAIITVKSQITPEVSKAVTPNHKIPESPYSYGSRNYWRYKSD